MSENQKQAWLIGLDEVDCLKALVNVNGVALMGQFEVPDKLKSKVGDFLDRQFGQLPSRNPVYQLDFSVLQIKLERRGQMTRQLQISEINDEVNRGGYMHCLGVITGIEVAENVSHQLGDLRV